MNLDLGFRIFLWLGAGLIWVSCILNFVTFIRHLRAVRELMALRVLNFAYEKQLRDMGATLPVRCVCCCQVLPAHVDQCLLKDDIATGRLTELLSRPQIQYNPDDKPPIRVSKPN